MLFVFVYFTLNNILSNIQIYPSEFGKEKMKQDELSGPKELSNSQLNDEGEAEGKLKSLSEKGELVYVYNISLLASVTYIFMCCFTCSITELG